MLLHAPVTASAVLSCMLQVGSLAANLHMAHSSSSSSSSITKAAAARSKHFCLQSEGARSHKS
jgi:hypothetical protein